VTAFTVDSLVVASVVEDNPVEAFTNTATWAEASAREAVVGIRAAVHKLPHLHKLVELRR
jgi:hypothetical protein